ncbi:MAG: hypothetical protein HFG54_08685 [Lachnospiraceae bacterium]|jgi:hypothetical protein|nr:hypothetical protein [Lachnospiraceae bacterium]
MQTKTLLFTAVAIVLLAGCSNRSPQLSEGNFASAEVPEESPDTVRGDAWITFNGITRQKTELSDDTLQWLEWYQTLPEKERNALSFIPNEFVGSGIVHTAETSTAASPSYIDALTEKELMETEELARYYFTEGSPGFDGVEEIQLADDGYSLYQNTGIEAEYDPGNIIIYMVLTGKDKAAGNPMRSISIARRSKSDNWKIINSGF